MNRTTLFFLIVIGVSLAAYKAIEVIEESATPVPVYGIDDHRVPAFEFTNQLNQTVSNEDIENQLWVVDFFFTSCPTICPKMTRNLQSLHDIIRQEEDIKILSFTVDPKRDTPERMKIYADRYNADHSSWYFLTGEKDLLYKLGNKGFLISATEAGDDTDFIHSENWVLVDRERRIRGFYRGTDPKAVDQVLRDIKKIKKAE